MTTRIEIDPNVRLGGTRTFAGFEHVRGTDGVKLYVGEVVEVVEPESRLYGKGVVESIDVERRLVYLDVEWAALEVVDPAVSSEPEELLPRPTLTVISGGRKDSLIDYGYPSEFVHVGVKHGGERSHPLALAMG
jgi:hypothetical protein